MTDTPKPAVPFTELKRAMVLVDCTLKEVDVLAFTFEADSPESMFFVSPFSGRWDFNIPQALQGYFVQLDKPRVVWCTFEPQGVDLVPIRAVVGMDLVPLRP